MSTKPNTKTFCMFPFTHLNLRTDGSLAPCFRSESVGKLAEQSYSEIWNGDVLKGLRKDLWQGTRSKICNACWDLEDNGVKSYRQVSLTSPPHNTWMQVLDQYEEDSGLITHGPKQIELRFSRLCNFRCRMCGPLFSSKWQDHLLRSPELLNFLKQKKCNAKGDFENFSTYKDGQLHPSVRTFLEDYAKDLESVLIAGGEPLINEAHYKALELMRPYAGNIRLEYSTNLSVLAFKGVDVLSFWKPFKEVWLRASIDGDPYIYEYVRTGSNTRELESNINQIHSASRHQALRLEGTFTTSIYNIERLVHAAKYFTKLGLLFHTSQVQTPYFLSTQVLPQRHKLRISRDAQEFLSRVNEDDDMFSEHSLWQDVFKRKAQLGRFQEYIRNSINYMNAADHSVHFSDFLRFDQLVNGDSQNGILDFFPIWRGTDQSY